MQADKCGGLKINRKKKRIVNLNAEGTPGQEFSCKGHTRA